MLKRGEEEIRERYQDVGSLATKTSQNILEVSPNQ